MICTCDICRNDAPISDEEIMEIIGEFMNHPRCSVKGKAAHAAVAAKVLRELAFCEICEGRVIVARRCPRCKKRDR